MISIRSRKTLYGGPPDSNADLNASSRRWRLIGHLAPMLCFGQAYDAGATNDRRVVCFDQSDRETRSPNCHGTETSALLPGGGGVEGFPRGGPPAARRPTCAQPDRVRPRARARRPTADAQLSERAPDVGRRGVPERSEGDFGARRPLRRAGSRGSAGRDWFIVRGLLGLSHRVLLTPHHPRLPATLPWRSPDAA